MLHLISTITGRPPVPIGGYRLLTQADLESLHRASTDHRETLATTSRAGCFHCGSIFSPTEIREWTDKPAAGGPSTTALCPRCGIDAVLPEAASIKVEPALLEAMREYWFK